MYPISFEFTIDEGVNKYKAFAYYDINKREYTKYHIFGYEVDCFYSIEEVMNFVKIERWRVTRHGIL